MSATHDENVPHEAAVDAAIDDQMQRTSTHAAIADVTATAISDAAAPGAAYNQTEMTNIRNEVVALNARLALTVAALNNALAVLRDAELIPTS